MWGLNARNVLRKFRSRKRCYNFFLTFQTAPQDSAIRNHCVKLSGVKFSGSLPPPEKYITVKDLENLHIFPRKKKSQPVDPVPVERRRNRAFFPFSVGRLKPAVRVNRFSSSESGRLIAEGCILGEAGEDKSFEKRLTRAKAEGKRINHFWDDKKSTGTKRCKRGMLMWEKEKPGPLGNLSLAAKKLLQDLDQSSKARDAVGNLIFPYLEISTKIHSYKWIYQNRFTSTGKSVGMRKPSSNKKTEKQKCHRSRIQQKTFASVRERTFERVGGLREHIQTLKEMIIYPLMYKELFESHGIEAPRGVLFHGPPGTGKTLVAGAVAAECSRSTSKRVAFYMRKGADCLNKYIGESEKNLQDLFTQAQNTRPSIIFFDEIDGLVPTRSESHEHHSSVVSTLLALMDGLDSKSEVFVIGATNRIDMIDPALRRPGRFDRELYFPLPPLESRVQILQIHTKHWKYKPDSEFLLRLASECAGYCGADLQSLCSQAVMESFRRNYPQITNSSRKLQINFAKVQVNKEDFWAAKEKVVPASQRIFTVPSRPLTPELEPLLKRSLYQCLDFVQKSCPFKFIHRNKGDFTKNKSISCPRVLLAKNQDQGHIPYLASAILHTFDHLPVTVIDLPTINDQTLRGSDSGSLVQKIEQARQSMPGIIFFPDIGSWWELIDETGRIVLVSLLEKLDSSISTQLFFLATSNTMTYDDLPPDVRKIFPKNRALQVDGPVEEERRNFFARLLLERNKPEPSQPAKKEPKTNVEFKLENQWELQPRQRRSRRQKGLEVEFLGIALGSQILEENKPKLGSYSLQLLHEKSVFLNDSDVKKPLERIKRPSEAPSWEQGRRKRLKKGSWDAHPGPDWNGKLSTQSHIKLQDLVNLCVEKTSTASTESVIKLYEQVEIVLLRFTSTWDPSNLFQELEREITSFNPF